jgi:UDP-2,3-diacylglucosamine pyrophosphatase LpxH
MTTTIGFEVVIMSDLHLGMKDCKPKKILQFLNSITTKTLILNGDIVDIDAINRGSKFKSNHMKVITKLIELAKTIEVIYIRGNHDDQVREFFDLNILNIKFLENYILNYNDFKYLVFHGDIIDISTKWKFLTQIGSIGYDIALRLNSFYNRYREWRGKPYLSISKIIKENFKEVISFINNFEKNAVNYAKTKGCDAAICGHIHIPCKKHIDNILYLNSGDWVENFTALGLTSEGEWQILKFEDLISPSTQSQTRIS